MTPIEREYEYLIRRARKNHDEKLAKELEEHREYYLLEKEDAASVPVLDRQPAVHSTVS